MEKQILSILKEMQGDIKGMQGDIKEMQGDIKGMQGDIKGMKEEITNIKITQKEHTQILRALEHNSEIAKSEREDMKHDINRTLGKVSEIDKTLSCVESVTAHNWSEINKIKSDIA